MRKLVGFLVAVARVATGFEDLCGGPITPTPVLDFANALFAAGVVEEISTEFFGSCSSSGTVTPMDPNAVVYTAFDIAPGTPVLTLTSGNLVTAEQTVNNNDGSTGINFYGSLPEGSGATGSTNDAARIEIIFTASMTGSIQFQYFFGSEEYNEWVSSSFNDIFALFLGKIDAYPDSFNDPMFDTLAGMTNVAIIPGTDIPVSISNVNLNTNSEFYNDNDPSDNVDLDPIAYDGYTDALMTKPFVLKKGMIYRLCLKIADVLDDAFDSGIYIKPGSFNIYSTDAPTYATEPPTPVSY